MTRTRQVHAIIAKKEREPNCKYVVSYGAGVDSTAMIIYLIKHNFPLDYVIFSDTGSEIPETYSYIPTMQKYLEKHNIPYVETMNRKRESLYDKCMRRHVIPSIVWRWCTRDTKITPIYARYRKDRTHTYQYMGINYSEAKRESISKVRSVTTLHPLIDAKITADQCRQIILDEGLELPLKSGCFFCPHNNLSRWHWLYKTHPDKFAQSMKLEQNSKHYPKQTLGPKGMTLQELKDRFDAGLDISDIKPGSPSEMCGGECST